MQRFVIACATYVRPIWTTNPLILPDTLFMSAPIFLLDLDHCGAAATVGLEHLQDGAPSHMLKSRLNELAARLALRFFNALSSARRTLL